jgi:hypothetical protein
MSSWLDSTDLIASVVRRAHIPESQVTFQDDDILAFANEEMKIGLAPSVMQLHEEFFTQKYFIPLTPYQSAYQIPGRPIGQKLRNLFYIDNSGNFKEMARILPENLVFYQLRSAINYPNTFYLENNNIILVPEISSGPPGKLVATIFQRPSDLVTSDQVATVQNINLTTGVITVDQIPSTFTLTSQYDFLQLGAGHKCYEINVTPLSINTVQNTMTFTPSQIPQNTQYNGTNILQVGDMICLAGQCFIPQLPDELHPVLAQRTACRILEAQGDLQALAAANTKLQEMEVKTGILIDNRTEGNPQKINNLRGSLREAKIRRRRNIY